MPVYVLISFLQGQPLAFHTDDDDVQAVSDRIRESMDVGEALEFCNVRLDEPASGRDRCDVLVSTSSVTSVQVS